MTKNGIIGISVGAAVILSSLAFYTHNAFSNNIKELITSKKIGKADIALVSQQNGLLNNHAQYKITFSADTLQQMTKSYEISESLELFVNHNYTSYPLFVASDITLDMSIGSLQNVVDSMPDLKIEHLLSINTNLLSRTHSSEFTIKPIHLKREEITLNLGKFIAQSNTNLTFSEGEFNFDFSEFNFDLGAKGKFSLSGLTSTASITDIEGMLIAPKSTLTLSKLDFASYENNLNISMENLDVTSHYANLEKDVLDVKSVMKMDSLNADTPAGAYDIKDTIFDITINNLDKKGLIAVDKASQLMTEPGDLIEASTLIFQKGINGTVGQLNTTVNGLTISSNGDFELPSYEGKNLSSDLPAHFFTTFTANYLMIVGDNYTEVFPQFSPMLDSLTNQGFLIKDDQGNLTSAFKIDGGTVTANGKRIR